MKTYKYETHLHTCQGSACSITSGADYISAYKKLGYSGIFVTDHFFGGNTAVPFDLDWKSRIEQFCSGYEAAAEANAGDPDFKVFFGFEQTFKGDDYLIYGLDKAWLLNHPEVETMSHRELFAAVNAVNGLMIQAHPFRSRDYIQAIHLHFRNVHGVEIYNAGNNPEENQLAEQYAQIFNFPVTSGSDIHRLTFLENPDAPGRMPVGGMSFDSPIESVFDYAERIKAAKGEVIK